MEEEAAAGAEEEAEESQLITGDTSQLAAAHSATDQFDAH